MLELITQKWPEILAYFKKEFDIADVSFNTWIVPLRVSQVVENDIFIVVPNNPMSLQYITKKYSLALKTSIAEITGMDFDIKFILPDQEKNLNPPEEIEIPEKQQNVFEKAGLNPKYTFSTFVVGENNNLAHAASLAVAETPADAFNPLYIYGGVGLGKTHLMQAIAHFILSHDPEKKVLYVTSETFTNEIVEAIRAEGTEANARFREKYRNCDVLLIDDIQFISGKESTQQEFFHTFNALYENKKQIILSSDKPPKEINNLEERLISRFSWGLCTDIQSPSYETRVAILRKKIEQEYSNAPVPDDCINFIAANVSSNIRELEGALTKIIAYSKLKKCEINIDFAANVLQDIFSSNAREVTPEMIIKVVAEHFGISVNDLTSKKRNSNLVYPRHLAIYLCRIMTDAGQVLIGKKFGNLDHSSVIYAYNRINNDMDTKENVKSDIDILKKKILPF